MKYLIPKKGHPAMKKAFKKLNNRRGASILIALLLFLICALAGAAAITAAASNMGRYKYLIKNQQTYLSVSSAARLFRDSLGNVEATADFTAKADAENEQHFKLDPELTPPAVAYEDDNNVNIEMVGATPLPNNTDVTITPDGIAGLLEEDLKAYVKNAFYNYYTVNLSDNDLWKFSVDGWTESHDLPISFEYKFDVKNDEEEDIKPVTVTINFYKEGTTSPPTIFSVSDPIDVKITIASTKKSDDPEESGDPGDTKYELTGELTAEVEIKNEDLTPVTKTYTVELADKNPDGTPMTEEREKSRSMFLKSTAKVTVKLNLDQTISRVIKKDNSEGGGGT